MNIHTSPLPRGVAARAAWFGGVVVAGVVAGFALGEPLEIYERTHVARTTRQAAESLQWDLKSDMQTRLLAQLRLAQLWSEHVLETEERWDLSSRLFLDHHSGYLTLEWVNDSYRVLCVAGKGEDPVPAALTAGTEQVLKAMYEKPRTPLTSQPVLTPRFTLPDGRAGLRVIVPVLRVNETVGFLVATVDLRNLLDDMSSDHQDLGYSVALAEGASEIYRMPGSRPEHEQDLAADGMLEFPGATWKIRVWPKPELLSGMRSSMPGLAMLLGGLLGAVLVVAVHFGQAARNTSRELRRAHDELEERVRARTQELEHTSHALKGEVADRRRAEDSYRDLSGKLLLLQDEERRRFARELHDSTAQVLGALAINVDRSLQLARAGEIAGLTGVLDDSAKIVEEVTQEIRTVSHLLHPPMLDDLGIEYALPWYADGFARRSGIAVSLDIEPDLGRLPTDIELTLFRIVQEGLANVHRHSGSRRVSIALSRAESDVTLTIMDFGVGIPKAALDAVHGASHAPIGVGIAGMRGRVSQLHGRLDITSGGSGTTIRAVLPLAEPSVHASPEGAPLRTATADAR